MSSQMPEVMLPPPGTVFIVAVQYSLSFLLIAAMMNSFIISILLVMFVFSTTSLRRRPVFILNVITLCLALLAGAFSMYGEIHTMLSPDVPQSTAILLSFMIVNYFAAMVAEGILMLRLLAAYPFELTPRVRFVAIMSVPVIIKIARIINFSVWLASYAPTTKGIDSALVDGAAYGSWNSKFDWVAQCIDNGFVSIMFLRRLRTQIKTPEGAIRPRGVVRRLRSLFIIAVSNFMFPVVLNIIQLGLSIGQSNYIRTSLVVVVNTYVIVIGVVFATVWASGTQYFESQQEEESSALSRIQRGGEKKPASFFDFPKGA
ncbi:hypothetical protein M405DRAFT_871734 [Rhizopogon salebrosus TDB-379]|nr:hypothetical protein M405DRAFT_871734 [Rhizopogon salebrosus TDB-379]